MRRVVTATFPLGPFAPYKGNPVLRPQGPSWESTNLYNPAAAVVDDRVVLLYRAHGEDLVSRLGIATSEDGLHFTREADPVMEPEHDYERMGCEDPRLALINGVWHLTYTGFDGISALLCLATSTDLRSWTKHGPIIGDFDTWATSPWRSQLRERRPWNKAGVIHPRPLGGRYWMWFGEGAIYAATSDDLRTWTPVTDEKTPLHRPTPGRFDADLVEIGAPPSRPMRACSSSSPTRCASGTWRRATCTTPAARSPFASTTPGRCTPSPPSRGSPPRPARTRSASSPT